MRDQSRGRNAFVDDLGSDWLLHQCLAAPVGPLAADVAVIRKNSAGTTSSFSVMSSPMRDIAWPQPAVGQMVLAGSCW